MKWMISGPEVANVLSWLGEDSRQHHEDTTSHKKKFRRYVRSFRDVFDEIGNPFEEGNILIHVVSKQIVNEEAIKSVHIASELGKQQYFNYVYDHLLIRMTSIYDKTPKNKLSLFREKNQVPTSTTKLRAISFKQDGKLFASLFVACQSS